MTNRKPGGKPQTAPGLSGRSFLVLILVLLLLAAIARLPQFLSRQMVVDGDEGIVGLMAKHLMEGKSFSPFFYGQRYGFTFLESGTAALFFALFGVSSASLKAAMLVLWIIGANLFILAMRRFEGQAAALITGVFLLFTPSWAAWSMKARGGYVTAFLLFGLALWRISILKKEGVASGPPLRRVSFILLGIIYGFLFISQPFFLLGAIFFVPLAAAGQDKGKKLLWFALGCALVLVPYLVYALRASESGWTPNVISSWLPRIDPAWVFGCLFATFRGSFIYQENASLGIMTNMAGFLAAALMFLFIVLRAWPRRRRRSCDVAFAASLGILLVLGITSFTQHVKFAYRYLLAIPPMFALLSGGVIRDYLSEKPGRRKMTIAAIVAFGLFNAASFSEFRHFTFYGKVQDRSVSERRVLERLISELERRNVEGVYSLDPLFQWIVTFESRERIAGRSKSRVERVSVYIERVDRSLVGGKPVAVVGPYDQRDKIWARLTGDPAAARNYREIGRRYVVLFSPSRSLIEDLGFRITEFR
jgi:4-amino-4-deoxy-L-arabinose transferase-like glycosyltransferase